VHLDFGRVFETQGNVDAAILEYRDALNVVQSRRRGPFRPEDEALAHRRMGGALDRLGRFADAEAHYATAQKLSPKDAKIWNDAGYNFYLQGRWSESERALRMAAKLAPDDQRIRVNLGLTLAAAGKSDEAFGLLSQSSGDAVGHANLGYLLAARGQVDLARRQYETALGLRPDFDLARRALAKLDTKNGGVHSANNSPDHEDRRLRTPAAPVDSSVKQASAARSKVPQPVLRRIPPAARSPQPVKPQARPADAPPTLDFSDFPPPPPL
jgi:Flp pilus assembly protein TadD